MGKLIDILLFMRKDIVETKNIQAKAMLKILGQRAILPSGTYSLPELRNKHVHFYEKKDTTNIDSSRKAAITFFSKAIGVLDYLVSSENRIFPKVIKIRGIHIDEWGRRSIKAIADDGNDESLFVDEFLEPGAIYLMYPLSNPMRVDSILIPAGDMVENKDSKSKK